MRFLNLQQPLKIEWLRPDLSITSFVVTDLYELPFCLFVEVFAQFKGNMNTRCSFKTN